jgi:hypothetical protein
LQPLLASANSTAHDTGRTMWRELMDDMTSAPSARRQV